MKTKNLLLLFGIFILIPTAAYSVTTTTNFTVNLNIDSALSLTKNNDINFGTVTALTAGTYKVDTSGTFSVISGSGTKLTGTSQAGSITINGSTTQAISITANNYAANNNVTPSAATCNYNGGGSAACTSLTSVAAPGAGKTLLIGVTLAVSGAQTAGQTAAPTFDIVVNYN